MYHENINHRKSRETLLMAHAKQISKGVLSEVKKEILYIYLNIYVYYNIYIFINVDHKMVNS